MNWIMVLAIVLAVAHLLPWIIIVFRETGFESIFVIVIAAVLMAALVYGLTMLYPVLSLFFIFTALYCWNTLNQLD